MEKTHRALLRMLSVALAGLVGALQFAPAAVAAPSITAVLTLDQRAAEVNGEAVQLDTAPVLEFSPANLVVKAGTRVTWVNLDHARHDVFGAGFESPTMTQGEAYSFTFTKSGTFGYGCTLHDDMTASITVQE